MKLPQLVLVLAAGLLLAASLPSDDVKLDVVKELQLEGSWKAISFERDGQKAPSEDANGFLFVITRNQLTLKAGAGVWGKATIKMDNSHTPSRIDLDFRFTQGSEKRTYLAIYAVEGNHLKLCLDEAGGTRPTEFATKAGSNTILYILKKAKP